VSIINIYRSAFDNTYDTITVDKNISIREALPEFDYENSLLYVNGYEVDENYIFKGNDICTIREFPSGKPGSSGVEIFLGIVTLGGYTIADAIVVGVTGKTILQHLISWLAPGASDTNTADGLESIPQLRGAKNQTNRNKSIPIVLGEHLYTPMYIGSPYTEIAGEDGEDQYYNALYLLGWGKLRVDELRLGPVSGLARNPDPDHFTDGYLIYDKYDGFCDPSFAPSNPQIELRQTAREVDLYPQRVVEERLNIELLNAEGNQLEVIRFSAKNPQRVQIEITLNNGLISYNDKGEKRNASVDIKVEWRGNPAGSWQEFGRIGTDGGSSPTSYNPSTHITTITRQKAKVMRFIAEKSFSYAEIENSVNRTIELRIVRETPQPTDTSRTADTVILTAIRTWCFDNDTAVNLITGQKAPQAPMVQKYRDRTARLGFRIKATENLQGTIDALNCMVTSYARTWNGTDWSSEETPTNNPASVALKILQSPALGSNAYPDSMLDLDSFGEFYEWCEEREYTCNGVLISEKRVDDLLGVILSTGRGMRILNGNRYGILIDKPRENPVTILNSQNVLEAKNQKNFDDLPDGFSIRFVNRDDGYQETEVFVMADGSAGPGPESKIESLEMPFVTDYKQVIKNGWYMLACRHLRPETWIRKLSTDGYLVGIGNRVDVQDDTIVVGIGEGATITGLKIENNHITEIQTDGVFDVIDMNKLYGIKIMQFDGINPGKVRTIQVSIPEPGIYRNFTVSIPLNADPPIPHEGDNISFGVYDRITTPAICFGKKNNGDGTFEVTLMPYQEGIYNTDSGEIPPYQANITTPQGLLPAHTIPPDPTTKNEMLEVISELDFQGLPATIHKLRPSADIIIRNQNGIMSPDIISCEQFTITGSESPTQSNKTIKYETNLTQGEEYYTESLIVGSDWEYIIFWLYDGNVLLDFEEIPVLSDGAAAKMYEVIPSVSVIRILQNMTIDPPTITCIQQIRTGNSKPVATDKTLVYVTSINTTETTYSGSITINPEWKWIEFRLYDDTTLMDAERVPVLFDGEDAFTVDLQSESIAIPCDEYGDPKPEAFPIRNEAAYYAGVSRVINLINKKAAFQEQIIPFPGLGIDIFSPMGVYPVSLDWINRVNSLLRWELSANPKNVFQEQLIPFPGSGTDIFNPMGVYPVSLEEANWVNTDVLESVTIDDNGVIRIAHSLDYNDINRIIVRGIYKNIVRESVLNITKVLDGVAPVTMNVSPDSETISYDYTGIPKPGQLPFTMKATLFKGTVEVTDLSWRGENVVWSLFGAPGGVTIDNNGVITVSPNAQLDTINTISVRVIFEGKVYAKILTINKVQDGAPGEQGQAAPTYLGKTAIITNTNVVYIQHTDNYSANVVAKIGDYIAYVGPSEQGASIWKKNYCLRWTENGWEQLDPLNSTNTDYYMRALRDITEDAEPGAFSVVFARKIMAMQATIDELTSKLIQVQNAIYGGPRFTANSQGQVIDNGTNLAGFHVSADGRLKASGVEISGDIEADSGRFHGRIEANDGYFSGDLDCGDLQVLPDPNSMQRFPILDNYAIGTPVSLIRDAVYNFLGLPLYTNQTFLVDGGEIDGVRIRNIEFISAISYVGITIRITDYHSYYYSSETPVGTPFWFQIGNGERKVRFINLPNSAGAAASGTLYKAQVPGTSIWAVAIKN